MRKPGAKPEYRIMRIPQAWMLCLWCALFLASTALAQTPPVGALITNTATAKYSDANGNPLPSLTASVSTELGGAPVLSISKLESSDPVAMGALLTYTIVYANQGNAPATGVTVTDNLSIHLNFQEASGAGIFAPGPPGGGVMEWTIPNVQPGESGSLTLKALVRTPGEYAPGDPDTIAIGTLIYNTVTIESTEGAKDKTIITTVGSGPRLALTKSADAATALPDGVVTYTLAYSNGGNQPATHVQIRDALPEGASYVPNSATQGGVLNGRDMVWTLPDLPAGTSGQVSFQVRVSLLAREGDTVSNIASIYCRELAPVPSNTVQTQIYGQMSMALTKTVTPLNVIAGGELAYTIVVENNGAVTLNDILVTDPLPSGASFVSADNQGTLSNSLVSWQVTTLAPGQSKELHLTLGADAIALGQTQMVNTATASAPGLTPLTAAATASISCRTQGVVSFVGTAGGAVRDFSIGDQVCLTVQDADRNQDPFTAETVSVDLSVPGTGDFETVWLTESLPNGNPATDSGLFFACLPSNGDAAALQDGTLQLAQDILIEASYEDPLDPLCGLPGKSQASIAVEPGGVVFDANTGNPVAGVQVTLFTNSGARASTLPGWPAGMPDTVVTGADGRFSFRSVPYGSYFFAVTPGVQFQFPSKHPVNALPPGYVVEPGSWGDVFTLSPQNPSVSMDIPLDPSPGVLSIVKTCNRERGEVGDIVGYELTIQNLGYSSITDVKIQDVLPHGTLYVEGSTTLDGKTTDDPDSKKGRSIQWTVPAISPGTTLVLGYRIILGPDSHLGDGRNTVMAQGMASGTRIVSNTASHQLKITQGVFTTEGTIIGKVFLDKNGNGIQDPPDDQGTVTEPGIPDAVIFTEFGLRIKTDRHGKYSIPAVQPGAHVLRLDETSLPPALMPVPLHNRFMGDNRSQFVDMHTHGLVKANFGVREKHGMAWPPEALAEPLLQEPKPKVQDAPLEEKILSMDNTLAFLSPANQATLPKDTVNVTVKGHSAGTIQLLVNGVQTHKDRIGKTVTNPQAKVAVYEFLAVPLQAGRANILEARFIDPYGNQRDSASITVQCVGKPARISIQTDDSGIPANPAVPVDIPVTIVDNQGRIVSQNGAMDVSITLGKILNGDMREEEDGHQVAYKSGRAVLQIQPPGETGRAIINVDTEGLHARREVYFTPHLRDMMVVGSGEVTLGLGDSDGDYTTLKKEQSFDEGGYADGRGAVFAQGRIFDKNLLTIGVDTAKDRDRQDDNIFDTREQTVDAPDKYPIYGDESEGQYLAQSREKIYAKIERDKSSLMYGDFETGFSGSRLSAYNRSFTGGYGDVDLSRFRLQGMATKTDQTLIVDVLRARGSSGYYYLSEMDVVEGSERVAIEVRDRNQPDRILSREVMSRGADYSVEYDLGAILFMEPVHGYDMNFNPVYVVVNYESRSRDLDYYAYGGRTRVSPFSWLDLGATGVVEENALSDYNLTGGDMTLHLPWKTTLGAEYAQTRAIFEELGLLGPETGEGWRYDLESKPLGGLRITGYYQDLSEFFFNPSSIGAQRGTESLGGEAEYSLKSGLSFSADYYKDDDRLNNKLSQWGSAKVGKKFTKTRLETGVLYENITEGASNAKGPNYLRSFDNDRPALDHETSLMAGAGYDYSERLSFQGRHHHSITGSGYHLTDAGVNLALTKKTTGYVRQEYAEYSQYEDMHTIVGLESQVADNTTAYNEMRLEDGASGKRNHQMVGLKHRVRINEDLTGNLSMEFAETVSGDSQGAMPDGFSAAGALRYIPDDLLKVTSRLEYTLEDSPSLTRKTYLGEIGLVYKLHPDYSVLARTRGFWDLADMGGDHIYSRTMAGLAFRPIQSDAFHMLAKTVYKHERNEKAEPQFDSDSIIPSLEGVYQASPQTQIIGKYACKFQMENEFEAFTDLWSGRVIHDITERFDASVGYRVFTTYSSAGSMRQGGFAELGVRAFKDLWISGGYCFDDFDTDLTGDSFMGQGPYIRIRFKFDENLFAKR
ncbi:MAG: DUF11 domain-containing protein [Desulfatibacillum sp.]|nr:DUF11 domain-containing protein [Desulfatibacillum sp.]